MPRAARQFSEAEITEALIAMIAWAGNAAAASRHLKSEGKLEISGGQLLELKKRHADRYDEMRTKYAAQLEGNLAHEYRDVARLAVEVQRLALSKAESRLKKNEDTDPGRTAANVARVAQSMTDKLLSLTGRPTQITETRGLQEILRSLAAKGVISLPEEAAQELPAGKNGDS